MDATLKKKWIDELRFGERKQGRHYLRSAEDEFCCLGVLCDIIEPDGWDEETVSASGGKEVYAITRGSESRVGGLPRHIQDIVGFDALGRTRDARVLALLPDGRKVASLAQLNDRGSTFDEIADIIEEKF